MRDRHAATRASERPPTSAWRRMAAESRANRISRITNGVLAESDTSQLRCCRWVLMICEGRNIRLASVKGKTCD